MERSQGTPGLNSGALSKHRKYGFGAHALIGISSNHYFSRHSMSDAVVNRLVLAGITVLTFKLCVTCVWGHLIAYRSKVMVRKADPPPV
jgi:hypothetical protein